MVALSAALDAWGSPGFVEAFKNEVQCLNPQLLPLQAGLSYSSQPGTGQISAVVLKVAEAASLVRVKAGIFYTGVIAGSCCADDPTPLSEQTEYCVVQFDIDKHTAQATLTLLKDSAA